MCYGGRIDDYEQCYQDNLEPDVFKNSFAYRFIASFSEQYHIELSAYTGAVGFDAIDGNLWVETEEQLKISAEVDRLQAQQKDIEDNMQIESENEIENQKKYDHCIERISDLKIEATEHIYNQGEIIFRRQGESSAMQIDLAKRLPNPYLEEFNYQGDEYSNPSCLDSCVSFKM